MSSSSSQPLAGRRIWIAGIGGAGMSAYALVAHAWGAEVAAGTGTDAVPRPSRRGHRGHDRARAADAARRLGGLRLDRVCRPRRGPSARRPARGARVAAPFDRRRRRTRQDDDDRDDRLLPRPARARSDVSDRRRDRAARRQRAGGEGWLVVEGDESDRSVSALRPEVAVLLNVDLDHHTTFGSRAEVAELFEEWLAMSARRPRGELEPVELELAVPGEHNRRNAAAAIAALELAASRARTRSE